MKTRNTALILAVLTALSATFSTALGVAHAAQRESFSRSFGMVGITHGQTARLNVVNLEDSEFVPCVRVELSFVDGNGQTLLRSTHEVERGKAAFLDLNGNQLMGRFGARLQVRAVARFVGTPDTRDADDCLLTLEVIDNATGRTSFINPPEPSRLRASQTGATN